MVDRIVLASNNGMDYSMDMELAKKISNPIKIILDEREIGTMSEKVLKPIYLPHVNGNTLKKVVVWCEHHKTDYKEFDYEDPDKTPIALNDIPKWDIGFFKIDLAEIFEIIQAANYLEIKGLLNISCKVVAKMFNNSKHCCKNVFKDFQEKALRIA